MQARACMRALERAAARRCIRGGVRTCRRASAPERPNGHFLMRPRVCDVAGGHFLREAERQDDGVQCNEVARLVPEIRYNSEEHEQDGVEEGCLHDLHRMLRHALLRLLERMQEFVCHRPPANRDHERTLRRTRCESAHALEPLQACAVVLVRSKAGNVLRGRVCADAYGPYAQLLPDYRSNLFKAVITDAAELRSRKA
eukprot:2196907-Pleurochrysis_carterae.AAC.1